MTEVRFGTDTDPTEDPIVYRCTGCGVRRPARQKSTGVPETTENLDCWGFCDDPHTHELTGDDWEPVRTEWMCPVCDFETVTWEIVPEPEKSVECPACPPDGSAPEPKTSSGVIEMFSRISGVDVHTARKIYETGYTSLDQIRSADQEDIAMIDGISGALSSRILADVGERLSPAGPFGTLRPTDVVLRDDLDD